MKTIRIVLVAALALLASCGGGQKPSAGPTTESPSASPSPSPSAPPSARVVYAAQDDLWLYDAGTDRTTRLTQDGKTTVEHLPRFSTNATITYFTGTSPAQRLYELNVGASPASAVELARIDGAVIAAAWDRGGRVMAFLAWNADKNIPHTLWTFRPGGRPAPVRRFPQHEGRGTSQDDDVSLAWSPDGSKLLLVDTHLDTTAAGAKPAIYVMSDAGKDLMPAFSGTHADWSGDAKSLYVRTYGGNAVRAWSVVDVPAGSRRSLPISQSALRLTTSPDGRRLAYDDGTHPGSVFVFDVAAKSETKVGTGFVAPLWIEEGRFVVTATRPCVDATCDFAPWTPGTSASLIDAATGSVSAVTMTSTFDADVRLG